MLTKESIYRTLVQGPEYYQTIQMNTLLHVYYTLANHDEALAIKTVKPKYSLEFVYIGKQLTIFGP